MRWSLRLGRIAGIVVQVHVTFFLLLAYVAWVQLSNEASWLEAARGVGFVLAIFGCVVLHELGHALTARRYGIPTKDITLLPIGGVARLQRMPDDPRQELLVALAGPAVNVVIAGVGALVLWAASGAAELLELPDRESGIFASGFLIQLVQVNALLAVFNMIPAFPMDGGRVLRALLAMRFDYRAATRVAASVGQGLAILFGILGLFGGNPILIFIALFVFLGARGEAEMAGMQVLFRGRRVRDAMLTRFRTLPPQATIAQAVDELLAGSQHDFPVVRGEDGALLGLLDRQELVHAVRDGRKDDPIDGVVRSECPTVGPDEPLQPAFERMRALGCASLPVVEGGRLVGVLTLENIGELLMVRDAVTAKGPGGR